MSVERKKDGSITIKNNARVTSITPIVSTYGERDSNYHSWVDKCVKSVNPCAHTFKKTEEYFLQSCDIRPVCPNDRRLKHYLFNVVMNCCKDKLSKTLTNFSFDMTDEEMEKWHNEQKTIRDEVMNSKPEQYGLIIRGYYLPHTRRNEVYYEKVQKDNQSDQNIIFFFEETTESFQCYNSGGSDLMKQLIVFRGVTDEDIKSRSFRFLSYISTLRDLGELPGIE